MVLLLWLLLLYAGVVVGLHDAVVIGEGGVVVVDICDVGARDIVVDAVIAGGCVCVGVGVVGAIVLAMVVGVAVGVGDVVFGVGAVVMCCV